MQATSIKLKIFILLKSVIFSLNVRPNRCKDNYRLESFLSDKVIIY